MLHLDCVRITGDEFGYRFSSRAALEQLKLRRCPKITCLKIPCQQQRLSYLQVLGCHKLWMIRIEAPNICSFHFITFDQVEFSLWRIIATEEPRYDLLPPPPLCT